MMTTAFPLRLTYRDIFIGVLIMLLAFALRVVVVFDRAAGDAAFMPPVGTDQEAYVTNAALYEVGKWPDGPFFWQPGVIYYLVGLRALVGDSIGVMRLAVGTVGALGCGLMVAVGWLLTHRRWGGWLAGLLLAFYPVAILYSTEFLTEGVGTVYTVLFLLLALWQREKLSLWRSALLGIVLGVATITRNNLIVMGLAWLALLALEIRPRRTALLHAGVTLVFIVLAISPVTLYNRQEAKGKEFPLLSTAGMDEVYRANNRDATGVRSTDPATYTVDGHHFDALLYDIQLNPLRFIELQIRKIGLYWSELESGNNLDYLHSGEAVSPLLRLIPLDFRLLTFLGWLGVYALLRDKPRMGIFFALLNLLIFASTMPLWSEGRLKQPAVVPLVATSSYLLVTVGDWVRAGQWRRLLRQYALPALALLLVLAWLRWAVDVLPQTRPAAGVPNDLRPLNLVWDDKLKLIGWRPLPEWPAAERGWTHFQRSYVVQLYWEVLEPVDTDYNFYLAYIVDGSRVAGFDRAVGGVSFYPRRTSRWQPGEIYAEIAGFKLPYESPLNRSGEVRLGVYRLEEDDESRREVIPVLADSLNADSITLQKLAVFDMGYQHTAMEGFDAADVDFGGQIALKGALMPERAAPGGTVTLSFYWKALEDLRTDYTLFVHIFNEGGEPVTQVDTQPGNNTLPTSTWPPDYPIADEVTLTMPDTPGVYQVYVGWYDAQTMNRLPIEGWPDGRLLLGEIRVEG